jgi:hypothetical protein
MRLTGPMRSAEALVPSPAVWFPLSPIKKSVDEVSKQQAPERMSESGEKPALERQRSFLVPMHKAVTAWCSRHCDLRPPLNEASYLYQSAVGQAVVGRRMPGEHLHRILEAERTDACVR